MSFPLPVDTAHVRPRTRQYHLFKWDLGEGIERSVLKVGAIFTIPWWLACFSVGMPLAHGFLIWIAPPAIATARAISRDDSGRLRMRTWADRADRWAHRSRRAPIVNADTAPASTAEPIETDLTFLVLEAPRAQIA